MRLKRTPAASWLTLAASVLICFSVWHWANRILAPANTIALRSKGVPIGNRSDLYARWLGTRELLLHGRDPYSDEITREIQIGFYGRPLDPLNPRDPLSKESFVYPIYVVFLLSPLALLSFAVAQEITRWLLLASIAGSVPLWMSAIGFRPRRLHVFTAMILSVSTLPALIEFYQQNLAALVVLLLAGAAAAAARNWLVLCGFLLALATVKPEISALVILWFVLWAAARWPERKRLLWSLIACLTTLVLAGETVSPHWLGRFLAEVHNYGSYGADPSILQVLLPSALAMLATALLLGVLTILLWRWKEAPADSQYFGWALAWVVVVNLAILPKLSPYNSLLLMPALLFLAARESTIENASLLARSLRKGAFACLGWQWATAVMISAYSLVFPATNFRALALLPDYTFLALCPLTLLAMLLCTFSGSGGATPTGPCEPRE